jgi:hypothetical protein
VGEPAGAGGGVRLVRRVVVGPEKTNTNGHELTRIFTNEDSISFGL